MSGDASIGIHRAAAAGFAAQADAYASGRPDYPVGLNAWLRDSLNLVAGKIAVDLGAGTGKFLPRLQSTQAGIVAVEPVAEMRTRLSALYPQIDVKEGTAERMPFADGTVDAVVCAQAFHWFANPAALHEIRRVLKPGGALGLVWNVRDESVEWVAALTRILTPHESDAPRFYSGAWRKVFPAEGFGELHETAFEHVHTGPAQQVIVDRSMSVSFIAALPPAQRQKVLSQLHDLIAVTPALAGHDIVSMPYRTHAFWCYRTA